MKTSKLRKARENAYEQGAIGFGSASDWLHGEGRVFSRPITERSKASLEQFGTDQD